MPNWCNNTLTLEGDKQEIQQVKHLLFKDPVNCKEFSFNCAVPQPDNLYREPLSSDKEIELNAQGIPNWYNWNNRNWGTKWDACNEFDTQVENNKIVIYFDSAWSPPTEWFYSFLEKIDPSNEIRVELQYFEIGMDFAGSYFRDSNGEVGETNGRIYQSNEDGEEIYYDSKMHKYRDSKGRFVSDDSVTYQVEY
jgi:hypothetical protein